ncbi:MAG: molybdate ABC transporter substrate-binding protein [Acidimicrobiia bacterium]
MPALVVAVAVFVSPGASASGRVGAKPTGAITVAAASSLTGAFTEIGTRFEKKHRGTDVTFSFDASSALVLQVQSGAPVDVLASADEANMVQLVDGRQVTTKPVVFAQNELEIAVKPGNPEKVKTLADLAGIGVVALCAREVPCGKYADTALGDAGVDIPVDRVTRGQNATATLTAVSTGDADAAIGYVTDVEAAGSSVKGVKIPRSQNQLATYPIALLADAANPATAKAFAGYVVSPAGQKILAKYGFLPA